MFYLTGHMVKNVIIYSNAIIMVKLVHKYSTVFYCLLSQVPTTVFTPLELAAVGMTEEKAAAEYGEKSVQVGRELVHMHRAWLDLQQLVLCAEPD